MKIEAQYEKQIPIFHLLLQGIFSLKDEDRMVLSVESLVLFPVMHCNPDKKVIESNVSASISSKS